MPYFRGLRTVRLRVNETDYDFLLDSAGDRTLVTPDVAAALGCQPRGHDVGHRMTGETVVFQHCPRLRATLAAMPIEIDSVAVFDVNALLPAELPRLQGVLALDALRGQIVSLDWAHDQLIIHSRSDGVAALARHGVPQRLATGDTGAGLHALVAVTGGAERLWFLLDSGDIKGTLVARHVPREGLLQLDANSKASLRVGESAPESIRVVPDDINYDGVFGTDFLLSRVVTLDLRRAAQP